MGAVDRPSWAWAAGQQLERHCEPSAPATLLYRKPDEPLVVAVVVMLPAEGGRPKSKSCQVPTEPAYRTQEGSGALRSPTGPWRDGAALGPRLPRRHVR